MLFRRRDCLKSGERHIENLEPRQFLAATAIAPLADAYVRDGSSAATNFGADPLLVVKGSPTLGNSRQAFLKFDASGIADTIDHRRQRFLPDGAEHECRSASVWILFRRTDKRRAC